ncbi:Unknown protein [Striga hermonthica]|uniref:Uncharacterized protein n=1 Tax=Striga hermonthica TaxID=68872 RepID=A0A9N7ML90_STRHE|nr:Unknown protein [Striga hermonthica]
MTLITYTTLKKSYLYNFFPAKEEEGMVGTHLPRTLVEIRDVHRPPSPEAGRWGIKKSISQHEVASGKVVVSFGDTFEHVLRHWNLVMAANIAVWGRKVAVVVWDVTDEKNPMRYEGGHIHFHMTPSGSCLLTCGEVLRARGVKAEDVIGLCWDSKDSCFHIKLFPSNVS